MLIFLAEQLKKPHFYLLVNVMITNFEQITCPCIYFQLLFRLFQYFNLHLLTIYICDKKKGAADCFVKLSFHCNIFLLSGKCLSLVTLTAGLVCYAKLLQCAIIRLSVSTGQLMLYGNRCVSSLFTCCRCIVYILYICHSKICSKYTMKLIMYVLVTSVWIGINS